MRRCGGEIVRRIFDFINAMPALFSFHDQIICLLYLLNGKFVRLNRLLYLVRCWSLGEGGNPRRNAISAFYKDAGLDPAINKLHWFLCGFEGAVLVRNSDVFPDYPLAQRQAIADRWFATMFARFKGHARLTFGSPFHGRSRRIMREIA